MVKQTLGNFAFMASFLVLELILVTDARLQTSLPPSWQLTITDRPLPQDVSTMVIRELHVLIPCF
jgi:hypothetical protein